MTPARTRRQGPSPAETRKIVRSVILEMQDAADHGPSDYYAAIADWAQRLRVAIGQKPLSLGEKT